MVKRLKAGTNRVVIVAGEVAYALHSSIKLGFSPCIMGLNINVGRDAALHCLWHWCRSLLLN